MKRALFFSLSVSFGLAALSTFPGCGGKVVVDAEGTGGAGGTTTVGSLVGPVVGTSVTVGPGPQTSVTTVGPGPGTSVSVSSVTTGPSGCDNQGDCSFCVQCSIDTECSGPWNDCISFQPCSDLLNCLQTCADSTCSQKCAETFPDGIELYNTAAFCIVCTSCFNDCDGQAQNCL